MSWWLGVTDYLLQLVMLCPHLQYNEIVTLGNLNWDWLKPASDAFKTEFNALNLTQLKNCPKRPNPRFAEKLLLIDLVLTNF